MYSLVDGRLGSSGEMGTAAWEVPTVLVPLVGIRQGWCCPEVLHLTVHGSPRCPAFRDSGPIQLTPKAEIQDVANQAAELVQSLGKDISNMKKVLKMTVLNRVHGSAKRLQSAIDMHSYLFTSEPKLNRSLSLKQDVPPPAETAENSPESYHKTMRKKLRRLYSWPSRVVDAFPWEGGMADVEFMPRLNALESTVSLLLATLASLLIDFVVRMDHLGEAVEGLSNMAKFKSER